MKTQLLVSFLITSQVFLSCAPTASEKKKNDEKNLTETINGVNMDMVSLKGGTFLMGSPENESARDSMETQHSVTVSDFYISATEVTFEQYDVFCKETGNKEPVDDENMRGRTPVVNISWFEANAFCQWLSKKTGKKYRLPTEAEWEYACRAGSTGPYNTGNELNKSQANFDNQAMKTKPAASYKPNAWGLYDMHGNVREWCADNCDIDDSFTLLSDTYINGVQNPLCKTGSYRICRGGDYISFDQGCRSASRDYVLPDESFPFIGFRVVCSPVH